MGASYPEQSVWHLGAIGTAFESRLYNGTLRKHWYSNIPLSLGWNQVGFTYNYETGSFMLYQNGNLVTNVGYILNTDMIGVELANVNRGVLLGVIGTGSLPLSSGTKTALHQIYNSTFTPEQYLWNFNNIRPEGV
jgi:hypothetical protein